MADTHSHRSVMLGETLQALAIKASGLYVDGTFGRGGHSRAILEMLGEQGRLLAFDKDPAAVAFAHRQFTDDKRFYVEQGSFAMLKQFTDRHQMTGRVDGILLDLGVSSPQLDTAERGFSFLQDGPLDMRMDTTRGISAADWLNRAEEQEIAQVLKTYGEERFARRIAHAIVEARLVSPIQTTGELAAIISRANPAWEQGKHPATRSFQAIRIYINSELEELQSCLQQSLEVLAAGGRLAVISFHSLEDRIVKRFIRDNARGEIAPRGVPLTHAQLRPRLKAIGKAVHPSQAEVDANPRSRSAVLRTAERLA